MASRKGANRDQVHKSKSAHALSACCDLVPTTMSCAAHRIASYIQYQACAYVHTSDLPAQTTVRCLHLSRPCRRTGWSLHSKHRTRCVSSKGRGPTASCPVFLFSTASSPHSRPCPSFIFTPPGAKRARFEFHVVGSPPWPDIHVIPFHVLVSDRPDHSR